MGGALSSGTLAATTSRPCTQIQRGMTLIPFGQIHDDQIILTIHAVRNVIRLSQIRGPHVARGQSGLPKAGPMGTSRLNARDNGFCRFRHPSQFNDFSTRQRPTRSARVGLERQDGKGHARDRAVKKSTGL